MMKRFLLILTILAFLSLSALPLTASAHPSTITCSYDGCTGSRVHDTTTCANSLSQLGSGIMYNHSGRDVGDFELWVSNTCHAYYATVYSDYGATEINNDTVQIIGSDDNVAVNWTYAGQGAGVYADGKMAGHDLEYQSECYTPSVIWYDYAGQQRFNSFSQSCWQF